MSINLELGCRKTESVQNSHGPGVLLDLKRKEHPPVPRFEFLARYVWTPHLMFAFWHPLSEAETCVEPLQAFKQRAFVREFSGVAVKTGSLPKLQSNAGGVQKWNVWTLFHLLNEI